VTKTGALASAGPVGGAALRSSKAVELHCGTTGNTSLASAVRGPVASCTLRGETLALVAAGGVASAALSAL